ncbi:MAG: hypothetical protein RMX96_04280 [Nostoc sp. ChiSLP02]|nr:hypothetical protein [Nostoc sp. DedSLP05]MDZ8098121.1 hypothetical protein [Nostoc sp. DedSLP01]MDZ8184065.1 hypothetical protein [Nostoc sp. ChiSLP02]
MRVGEFLDEEAQAGRLPRTARVEGAAEISRTRSGDYRFVEPDSNQRSGDLLQPESASTRSIETKIMDKGNQAEIVVVELGLGESGLLGVDEARTIAENVLNTPDHGVNRVIFIKNGQIILDYSR